jgi:hypothetical protein
MPSLTVERKTTQHFQKGGPYPPVTVVHKISPKLQPLPATTYPKNYHKENVEILFSIEDTKKPCPSATILKPTEMKDMVSWCE